MNRLDILRRDIDVANGNGLEIGPLASPIVTPDLGRIRYVDHASTEELRRKYASDPAVDENAIMTVDFVWGEKTLAEAVGAAAPFDYVVASHVLEHVPDLVGWLNEVRDVLRPGGRLSLCMPDNRYTFDVRRRTSSLAEVVEARLLGLRRPAVRATFDHFYWHVDVDTFALWRGERGHDDPPPDVETAMALARAAAETDMYVDTHAWVFTDAGFVELIGELMRMDLIDLRFVSFTPVRTNEFEFFVTLERPAEEAPDRDRVAGNLASLPRLPRAGEAAPAEEVAELVRQRDALAAQLAALEATKIMRYSRALRELYRRLRAIRR